jgi:hypothetical protein
LGYAGGRSGTANISFIDLPSTTFRPVAQFLPIGPPALGKLRLLDARNATNPGFAFYHKPLHPILQLNDLRKPWKNGARHPGVALFLISGRYRLVSLAQGAIHENCPATASVRK